ncbi:hypothetical protein E2C01_083973 [Portunus trituberculatus]|uniref:Uncharacterized protein n=1 Tax=Portunus trituberculatus TaxID=210409 RepID=A0A5B7J523_PORTR|nr:hypothetical protein [Portunus trituberculatus]
MAACTLTCCRCSSRWTRLGGTTAAFRCSRGRTAWAGSTTGKSGSSWKPIPSE